MNDQQRRARAFAILGEAFRQRVSETMLDAYELGLSDLSGSQVEQAVTAAIRGCKFCPTPAELRELAGEATAADRALLAWQSVERATSIGSYRSVDFEDAIINAVIRTLGGWPALLARTPEEFDKWARKDFLETYRAFARTGVDGESCRPLPGLSESGSVRTVHGGSIEHRAAEPVRIEACYDVRANRTIEKPQALLELRKP